MNLDWLHSSSTFLAIGVIHPRLLDITIMNEINALVTQLLTTSTVLQLSKQINLFERPERHLIYVESMYRKLHFFCLFHIKPIRMDNGYTLYYLTAGKFTKRE